MPRDVVQASIVTVAVLCTSVTLSGCQQESTSTPFYTSGGVRVQAPPAAGPAPGVPGAVGPFDGIYQGPANAVFTGAGRCMGTQQVTDFHVRNNVAQWAGYTGTIDPSGAVQMHRGGFDFLTGRFHGNRFVGRLETGAFGRGPSCVYQFALQRVGA